jgi:hypothetical protein
MSSVGLFQDSANRLAAQADAIGRLAQDGGAFAAAIAAFESRDPDAFRWVLERLELLPRCELICEWIRVKLCALRCVEVCGPPDSKVPLPELPQFAGAIIQLASNEALLRRVVDAVACGQAESYQAAIAEANLQSFCHLLCRYVCSTIYRRICEIICTPRLLPVQLADAVLDIRADAEILSRVLANENLTGAIGKAAVTLDCVPLRAVIDQAGFARHCEIICRLICVWRCVWGCWTLCIEPPPILTGIYAVEEARKFALAARGMAAQPRALADLVAAVATRNANAYGAIVARFGLGPYCWQVCGWVCSEICHVFCICVCPPQLFPEFTAIGGYNYQTQIDSALPATGLTNGDTRAFFETLRLNGVLTQTLGGQPLEYRFEFQPITVVTTSLAAAITAVQTTINVTSSVGFPAAPFNAVIGGANGGYEIVTVTMVVATTWTVLRGRQGTAAVAAAVGATITTGAAASGGWTPVPQGWIATTVIGIAEVFHPLPTPHFEFPNVTIKPVNPGDIPVTFAPGDWVQVPQGSNIFLNGNMMNLISTMLPSFPPADETGVTASNPANHPLPTDHCYGLRMRVRQQGSVTESDGGTCAVAAIDNTLYNNVNHHPEWDGGIFNPQFAVAMVDIKELQAAGCAGITNSLTVLFTASHPNLGAVSIQMIGPGGPYPFTLPTPEPETGDWYGVAAPNGWKLADLTPCAYIVQLSVDLLLTTGDQDFGPPIIDQIAFCLTKGKGK